MLYMNKKILFSVLGTLSTLFFIGCKEDVLPKPSSYLRLEYPKAKYAVAKNNCPFEFEMNDKAKIASKENCGFTLHYPAMKATVYITYKPVQSNLSTLLKDAQKLTYEHVIKADEIVEQPFVNQDRKVYGMFYQVGGNAATNAQFYLTDSIHHFVTGSMYFYAKPNFDSILPAADYVKKDIRHIMETMKWK